MRVKRKELDVETKKMKEKILRQIILLKNIDIKDRQKLCKIRSDKKAQKLLDGAKKASQEIMNQCEEILVTKNGVIYAGTYVITEKQINGKPKNYNNRRKHKQPLWKTKVEKEINKIREAVVILDELLRHAVLKLNQENLIK